MVIFLELIVMSLRVGGFAVLLAASSALAGSPSINPSSPRTGWGRIEVSPNAFMSLPYQNFHVSIYRKTSSDPNDLQFYYSPALILDPAKTEVIQDSHTKQWETVFEVVMWDTAYRQAIQAALSAELGRNISDRNFRMLPIEAIRTDFTRKLWDEKNYEIDDSWVNYANQASRFSFHVKCLDSPDTCRTIARDIKERPVRFVKNLEVYYSLQTQQSSTRQVTIRVDHARASPLYLQLSHKFPTAEEVYLRPEELRKMSLEIATNVLVTEVRDENVFVSHDQASSISAVLSGLLQVEKISSGGFSGEAWKSVYWKSENARPDVVLQTLNEMYERSRGKVRTAIESALNSSATSNNNNSELDSLDATDFEESNNGSATPLIDRQNTFETRRARLTTLLGQARNYVRWSGHGFVLTPIELQRISLAMFRSQTTATSTQVRVTRTTSELTSRINVVDSPDFLQQIQQFSLNESSQFCIGSSCLKQEDFKRLLQLRTVVHPKPPATEICLEGSCLKSVDFRRILNLPTELRTQRIVGLKESSQFCIGSSCLKQEDFIRVSKLHPRANASQSCIGELCLTVEDYQRVHRLRQGEVGGLNSSHLCLGQTCISSGQLQRLKFFGPTPCAGTTLRVSGATVLRSIDQAPPGRVCIGNTASPSPTFNFLVFTKKRNGTLSFLGTQSVDGGFRDFTPYVTWAIERVRYQTGNYISLGGCSLLPVHFVSTQSDSRWCSRTNPTGKMWLLAHNAWGAVVEDDGSISVVMDVTPSATLWYGT